MDPYCSTLVMKGTLSGFATIRCVQICKVPMLCLSFIIINWKDILQCLWPNIIVLNCEVLNCEVS